jgi:hypothetical protein
MKETLQILKILLTDGELNDASEPARFADFKDPKVRAELENIAEELMFTLVEVPHAVYLVPEMDNPFLSLTLGDLRKGIGSAARTVDAFLQCYIMMVILYLFFGGKNTDPLRTPFLQIKDIVAELDKRFSMPEEQTAPAWQEEMEINFTQAAQIWNNLSVREDNRRTSREETVLKACRTLEKQKLIGFYEDGTEIRPTVRLKDLMTNYYLGDERVSAIHSLFAGEENNNA